MILTALRQGILTRIKCQELFIVIIPWKLHTVATPIVMHIFLKWVFFPLGFSAPEQKNPLLHLKQSGVGIGIGRVKRRYKRKNAVSPVKKGPSPVKRRQTTTSPAKIPPPSVKPREPMSIVKVSQWRVSYMKVKVFLHGVCEDEQFRAVWNLNNFSSSHLFTLPRLKMVLPHRPQKTTYKRLCPNSSVALPQRWPGPVTWRTSKLSYGSGSPP